MTLRRTQTLLVCLLAVVAVGALVAAAPGAMRSKKIGNNLCRTTGGGKFVRIPGFPGERIDRRLLPDVKYLVKRVPALHHRRLLRTIPSTPPTASIRSGSPLDLVPDKANGGSWKLVSRLAKRAEPVQNQPIAPWRWVGYNGDAGHGRGNHLHLSWNHSDARAGHPAKTVYTMRCPGAATGGRPEGRRRQGRRCGNGGLVPAAV